MQPFKDLRVWQRAHKAALQVYRATAGFPEGERYGLVSQSRRAAVSVCANIAEGSKRKSPRDYARILNIAEGSSSETECLLMIARDLEYLTRETADRLLEEYDHVGRMLSTLRSKVESAD